MKKTHENFKTIKSYFLIRIELYQQTKNDIEILFEANRLVKCIAESVIFRIFTSLTKQAQNILHITFQISNQRWESSHVILQLCSPGESFSI